jgi:hypothetical protein
MATIHWRHGVNGDFAVAANWNPATVPGSADTAAIIAVGTYTVGSAVDETVNSLTTIKTATLAVTGGTFTATNGTGIGANAGTIAVGDGADLVLGGVINNAGKIKESSTGDPTLLEFAAGATLKGGGKVLLSDNANNQMDGGSASAPVTNLDNTIAGAGTIGGAVTTVLVNEAKGVINATGKVNPLILNPSFVTNHGILEATGSAGLIIATTVDNWPTGIVQAVGPGAVVTLTGTLIGGTLKTANGGTIKVALGSTATLDGSTPDAPVTNTGSVVVTNHNTLALIGTIANKGSIAVNSTGDTTELLIGAGGAALQGGGKVALADGTVTAVSSSTSFANVDNTISGAGVIEQLTLTNGTKGVIDATKKADGISLDNVNCSNAGTLEATAGSTLIMFHTNVSNTATGVVAASGAGSRVSLDQVTLVGGTLRTAGGGKIEVFVDSTIDGSAPGVPVNNSATLAVDATRTLTLLGTINNTGSIALGSSAKLLIGAGGAALKGGGKVTLVGSDEVTANAASDKLVNADNIISGAGAMGHVTLINGAKGVINATDALVPLTYNPVGAGPVINAGTIEATNAAGLLIQDDVVNSGTIKAAFAGTAVNINGTVTNSGKLLAAAGKLLIFFGATGPGSATINYGGEIEFGSAGITQNVTFANVGTGTAATLRFDATASTNPNLIYNGVISGFSNAKDRIDLRGLAFSGNTALTKTLQDGNTVIEVTESGKVVDLTLAGNHMADKFVVSNDGAGGTLIVDPPAPKPDLSHLVHAIATFGMPHAFPLSGAMPLASEWTPPSMLAAAGHHG